MGPMQRGNPAIRNILARTIRNRSVHGSRSAQVEVDEIALEFIPSEMTVEWQPLDLRIFESLKQRAKALFDAEWMRDPASN